MENKYTIIKNDDQYFEYCSKLETLLEYNCNNDVEKTSINDEIQFLYLLIKNYHDFLGILTYTLTPIEFLNYFLKEHNLDLDILEEELNLTKGVLGDIIKNKKEIPKNVIDKLSKKFKIRKEAFVSKNILDSINITRSFYETFGHKTGNVNVLPTIEDRLLRIDLIQEESHELSVESGVEKRFMLNSFNYLFFNKKENKYKDDFDKYSEILDELKNQILNSVIEKEFNLDGVVDATSDLRVVLDGSEMCYGIHVLSKEALEETNRSNMSKGCLTEDEALYNASEYAKEGIEVCYVYINDMYVLYNKENNKILKNKLRFKKPDYSSIIKKYLIN